MIHIKADNFFSVYFFQVPDTILITVSITSPKCYLHVTFFTCLCAIFVFSFCLLSFQCSQHERQCHCPGTGKLRRIQSSGDLETAFPKKKV